MGGKNRYTQEGGGLEMQGASTNNEVANEDGQKEKPKLVILVELLRAIKAMADDKRP